MQTALSWYELASGYCFHREIRPNIYICFTQRGNKHPQTKALVKGVFVQQHSWSAPRYPHPELPLGAVLPHLQSKLGLQWMTWGSPGASWLSCWAVALTGSGQDRAERSNGPTWACLHFTCSLCCWGRVKMKRSQQAHFGRFALWTN